jgi:hypothetical protein
MHQYLKLKDEITSPTCRMLHYNSIPFQRLKHIFLAKHLFVTTCGFLFAHNNVVECIQIPRGCGQMLAQIIYI